MQIKTPVVVAIIIAVITSIGSGMSAMPSTPDFAFPQDVNRQATRDFSAALQSRSGVPTLEALIQLSIARNSVSPDSVWTLRPLYAQARQRLDVPYSTLATLLEARLLSDAAGVSVSPDSVRSEVKVLVEDVLDQAPYAKGIPLTRMAPIVENAASCDAYGLDLYDFIMMQCAGLLTPEDIPREEIAQTLVEYHRGDGNIAEGMAVVARAETMDNTSGYDYLMRMLTTLTPASKASLPILQALYARTGIYDSADFRKMADLLPMMREAVSSNPSTPGVENVRAIIAEITRPDIRITVPDLAVGKSAVSISCTVRNLQGGWVLLYSIPYKTDNAYRSVEEILSQGRLVQSLPLEAQKGGEGQEYRCSLTTAPLSAGCYAAVPSKSRTSQGVPKDLRKVSVPTLNVSDISVVTLNGIEERNGMYVVDSRTFRPVGDAEVSFRGVSHGASSAAPATKRLTDKDGFVSYPAKRGEYQAKYQTSKVSGHYYTYQPSPQESRLAADIFTDLGVYHPSDTVKGAAVVYSIDGTEMSVTGGRTLTFQLRDTEYKMVASRVCTSDAMGRIFADFVIPSDSRLGRFTLTVVDGEAEVSTAKKGGGSVKGNADAYTTGNPIAFGAVEVAEYKLPTIYLTTSVNMQSISSVEKMEGVSDTDGEVSSDKKDDTAHSNDAKSVMISGVAMGYDGVALQDAKVSGRIVWHPYRLWRGHYPVSHRPGGTKDVEFPFTAVTNREGVYQRTIPLDSILTSSESSGYYTVHASVVAPWGENAEAQMQSFAIGEAYSITPSIPSMVEAEEDGRHTSKGDNMDHASKGDVIPQVSKDSADGSEASAFRVEVSDIMGRSVTRRVHYTVMQGESMVTEGVFVSPVFHLPIKNLKSGEYRILFTLEGDTAVKAQSRTVIWRPTDSRPPVESVLWVPKKNIIAPVGCDEITLTVGRTLPDGAILMMVSDMQGDLRKREWIYPKGKNIKVRVSAPRKGEVIFANFISGADFKVMQERVKIESAADTVSLHLSLSDIKGESVRNRVQPGSAEQWKISVKCGDAKGGLRIPSSTALMAVITDKALDAIAPFSWHFSPRGSLYIGNPLSMQSPSADMQQYLMNMKRLPTYHAESYREMMWNFYGQSLYGYRYSYDSMPMLSSAGGAVMIRGAHKMAMTNEAVAEAAVSEAAVSDMGIPKEESNGDGQNNGGESEVNAQGDGGDSRPMRPSETPLALYRPDLTVSDDGELSLRFDWPDANAAWRLQMIAYDSEMHTAALQKEILAARTLMVKSALPSFLRRGDAVILTGVVSNAGDTPLEVGCEITVLDHTTGRVLATMQSDASTLQAAEQRVVEMAYNVPDDVTQLEVRIRANSPQWSDAEYSLIPVLEAVAPVREAEVFYLDGSDAVSSHQGANSGHCEVAGDATGGEVSITLPHYPSDAKLTLRYSGNPVWYCIDALPDVMAPESVSVTSLADALYANAATASIRSKAGVKDESATLQIVQREIVEKLAGLQHADGAFGWCPEMPGSPYITRYLIERIGMMQRSGFRCESDTVGTLLGKITNRGVEYIDSVMRSDLRRYPKSFNALGWLHWLDVREMTGVDAASWQGDIIRRALKGVADDWRSYLLVEKGFAARMLHKHGNASQRRMAQEIVKSVSQFAVNKPRKGAWFEVPGIGARMGGDNISPLILTARILRDVDIVNPQSALIPPLRQWLLLQRETVDWGVRSTTVEVVDILLNLGHGWTQDLTLRPDILKVYIDGRPMTLSTASDSRTGGVTQALHAKEISGKTLTFTHDGANPAWGGVTAEYPADIKSVKSAKVDDLSISRSLSVVAEAAHTSKEIGVSSSPKDVGLKRGGKVTVMLTLTVGRDMDYVEISDMLPAGLRPIPSTSGYEYGGRLCYYREVGLSKIKFYVEHLPKGIHRIEYQCVAEEAGCFAAGFAEVASLLSPLQISHTAGSEIKIGR